MIFRIEVTVLFPVQRMAPMANTLAWVQTGFEKRGAKAKRTSRMCCGKENIAASLEYTKLFYSKGVLSDCPPKNYITMRESDNFLKTNAVSFAKPEKMKMAKVECK